MKTISYNPSQLEVEMAQAVAALKDEIVARTTGQTLTGVVENLRQDNPTVVFKFVDTDGDAHSVIVQFIQRMDG